MLMSPLNGVNKELTGRVSLCAARAGGVMAAVSGCNYTLSPCILAAVVGEQRLSRVQGRGEGGQKGGVRKSQHLLCFLCAPRTPLLRPRGGCAGLGSAGRRVGWGRFGAELLHLLLSPLEQGGKPPRPPLWGWGSVPGRDGKDLLDPSAWGSPTRSHGGGTGSVLVSPQSVPEEPPKHPGGGAAASRSHFAVELSARVRLLLSCGAQICFPKGFAHPRRLSCGPPHSPSSPSPPSPCWSCSFLGTAHSAGVGRGGGGECDLCLARDGSQERVEAGGGFGKPLPLPAAGMAHLSPPLASSPVPLSRKPAGDGLASSPPSAWEPSSCSQRVIYKLQRVSLVCLCRWLFIYVCLEALRALDVFLPFLFLPQPTPFWRGEIPGRCRAGAGHSGGCCETPRRAREVSLCAADAAGAGTGGKLFIILTSPILPSGLCCGQPPPLVPGALGTLRCPIFVTGGSGAR